MTSPKAFDLTKALKSKAHGQVKQTQPLPPNDIWAAVDGAIDALMRLSAALKQLK